MRRALLLATTVALASPTVAAADTLQEALLRAYRDNPTITGSRANQRATDETVPIAKAQGRPTASAQAQVVDNFRVTGNSFGTASRRLDLGAGITVPLYQGGFVRNSVRAAERRVEAGQAGVRSTEIATFSDVVSAYNNVIRDEAIVGLNAQNVRVLDTNLRASRDRFQVGDLTRTDVAQSEARLAIARAQLQTAEANLIASREDYVRLVGQAPGTLEAPPPLPNLPATPDAAVSVATVNNPALLAAVREAEATRFDVGIARSLRQPRIDAIANQSASSFLGSLADPGLGSGLGFGNSGSVSSGTIRMTVPLYSGGEPAARVRQAQANRSRALEAVTETERQVVASARSAYAVWQSSLAVIQSSETAVNANKLALEGVRAENSVGTRTILDILDAERELLNSQVTLVTARRDAYVAGFALLAAMGEAEAQDLNLNGGPLYNPVANYERVKNKWSDWADGPAAQPIAVNTSQVPAQNAVVAEPKEPLLENNVNRARPLTTGASAPDRQ